MTEVTGKTVTATKCIGFKGYNVTVAELVKVGMVPQDTDDTDDTLYFLLEEIEVLSN